MEWVETTGKTVAAAREAALDELGVDERDAEVVVVAEPRSGIFGIGRVEARVRARVRPAAPRPKRQNRSRRGDDRSRGRSRSRGQQQDSSERGATSHEDGDRPGGDRPSGAQGSTQGGTRRRSRNRSRNRTPERGGERTASAGAAGGDRSNGTPRDSGQRGKGRRDETATETRKQPTAKTEENEMTIEQQAAAVERFVSGIVERFGFDGARTDVRVVEDHVLVDVTGEDLGLLVGPRGRTLDALQELARTVVQRRGEEAGTRVVVDVAGFRAKRTAALESFVRRVTDDVLAQGEAQALEPMGPADRKVVHDTVNTIEGVETTSEGTEPNRYVVIRPSAVDDADDEDIEDDEDA